ncbi:MAG: DUF2461 domain-containing protein [Xanthomonadales bacterium]|nr:DUF2461 domain-containing protein [Xanthomonadales bacterium]
MAAFKGFPADLFRFFQDLSAHNDRDWFNAHRDRYQASVVDPMCAFIAAMAPRLARISRHYVADPRPNGGSMFRIYRDVRFSKDKSPYKTHAACHFRHEAGKDAHAPGFYVHLEPGRVFFGGGIWRPPSPALAAIREHIVDAPKEWSRVTSAKAVRERGGIRGEQLQRAPRGFDPEHAQVDDLKRKSFYLVSETTHEVACSPAILSEVTAGFRAAGPLARFVCGALELPF